MNYPQNFDCEKCGGLVEPDTPEENWNMVGSGYIHKDDFYCTNCGINYGLFCNMDLEEDNPKKYTIEIIE